MSSWSSKQYHNNAFYAGQRRNYLCTQQCFLICQSVNLASRYVILYACVTMVLDSNGPIIKFKSMSLKQKQTAQNYLVGSGQMYVLSILIIFTTKGGSEHTSSQYFLAWMSPCMVIQTSVFVHNMTWKGIEQSAKITLPDFSFKLRIDQGRKLKHIKAENIYSRKLAHYP